MFITRVSVLKLSLKLSNINKNIQYPAGNYQLSGKTEQFGQSLILDIHFFVLSIAILDPISYNQKETKI